MLNKQKISLISILFFVLILPYSNTYSSVGSFNNSSFALEMNNNSIKNGNINETATFTAAVVAVSAAVSAAYFAGWVVGRMAHSAYDALGGHPQEIAYDYNYNPLNFVKFDN